MLAGMGMLLKSMGLKPEEITAQVEVFLTEAGKLRAEIERQGRLIDAIAKAHGVNPRDFDSATTKEIEHGN